MTTVREKVLAHPDARKSVRTLFILYTAHARQQFKYSARVTGHGLRDTLLDRPDDAIVTVDCDIAANGLKMLINEIFPLEAAEVKVVSYPTSFATAERSRCFDPTIVGNIRRPNETWAQMSRCIFKTHYFVATGAQTRWYLDPCMFTSYSSEEEVKSWTLKQKGRPFDRKLKFVNEDPSLVLLAVPPGNAMPPGFATAYVVFNRRDFSKKEWGALDGRAPGVHNPKFHRAGEVALAKINQLLQRAGVAVDWGAYDPNA